MRRLCLAIVLLAMGCSSSPERPLTQRHDAAADAHGFPDVEVLGPPDLGVQQEDGAEDAGIAEEDAGAEDAVAEDATTAPPDAAPDAGMDAGSQPGVTTLRVHYPAGTHSISVRGSGGPLNWNSGLATTSAGTDTFTFTIATLAAPIEWKPLLDDSTWSRGANYRVAPGQTADVYPHFTTIHGQVLELVDHFHSTLLNNDRGVWAYLPPSYDENPRASYPVLYMHDGQNLFDPALAFGGNEWRVDETLDFGIETNDGTLALRELIVIGPENTSGRIYEYTPTRDSSVGDGGGGELYLRMLVEELKPQVDAMLRTLPARETTGIMGSSLGGLISAYAGVEHADTFAIVGEMSPSTWWDNRVIIGDVMGAAGASPRPLRVYVDSGDSGPSMDDVANTNMLAQTYLNIGYVDGVDFMHVVQMGAQHNEIYWAQRLPGALRFLFGDGR